MQNDNHPSNQGHRFLPEFELARTLVISYGIFLYTLRLEGIQVPRKKVQETLKELDPEAARREELNVCEGDGIGILAQTMLGIWMATINLSPMDFQFMGVSPDSISTFPQKKRIYGQIQGWFELIGHRDARVCIAV